MMTWSSLGPLLGLDNALVALALAPVCHKAGRLWLLAAWFAVVEAAAPVAGALLGSVLPVARPPEAVQTAVVLTLGLAVLGMNLAKRDPARLVGSGRTIGALALLLGIDNLLAGAGMAGAADPLSASAASGFASAGVVLMACAVGRLAAPQLPAAGSTVGCAALLLAAGAIGLS